MISLGALFPDTPPEDEPKPKPRKRNAKQRSDTPVGGGGPDAAADSDSDHIADQERLCGTCGVAFQSVCPRDPKGRPIFIPLHCTPCDEANGEWLLANDPLYNKSLRRKFIFDRDGFTIKFVRVMKPTKVFTGEKRHARYSPSTYQTREKCPGWMPDNDPSKSTLAADRGTMIHAAIEEEDTSKLTDDTDIKCAEKCMAYVERIADARGPHERFRELQVKVLDQFGIVDDLIISGPTADMTDYKTGYREVTDAEENAQMQGYALGVFDQYPKIETVNVHMLMPRQDVISTFTYTRADHYKKLKERIFNVIEKAKAVDQLFEQGNIKALLPQLNPSPANCEYCGRKAACPALHEMALTIASRYDQEFVIPTELHGSEITDPSVMARALMIAPIMEEWAKGVKKAALEMRMKDGVELPGWRLAERKGARKISDAQIAWNCVQHVITPEEFAGCADVSMPELEKAFAQKAPRGKKSGAKQELEDQLRDRGALKDAATVYYLKQERK